MATSIEQTLEEKFAELKRSPRNIHALSSWLVHRRKHAKSIVKIWIRELRKAQPNEKLPFMYVAKWTILGSLTKGSELSNEFSMVLSKAFANVSQAAPDEEGMKYLERMIYSWEIRKVYDSAKTLKFHEALHRRKGVAESENSDGESLTKLDKYIDDIYNRLMRFTFYTSKDLQHNRRVFHVIIAFSRFENACNSFSAVNMKRHRDKLRLIIRVKQILKLHFHKLPDVSLVPSVVRELALMRSASTLCI